MAAHISVTHSNSEEFHAPYKKLTILQNLSISSLWAGLNCVWGAMLAVIMPYQVELIVGTLQKAPLLGLARMAGAVIATFLPLFVGGLSDRCMSRLGRRRPYILVGVTIALVSLFLMLFAADMKNYALYLIGFCVLQVGMNIAAAAYYGIIPDIVPLDQRGIASGYMGLMSNVGTMAGFALSGFIIGKNTTLSYILIGVVLLITTLVTLLGVQEVPLKVRQPKIHWPTYIKSLWISPREYPDFAWVWITRFLVMFGFYFVQPYMLYYLQDVVHVKNPLPLAASVGGLILITAALSSLWAGVLSERFGRKKVVYVANTLVAIMSVMFIFCRNMEQVFIVAFLFGIGFGAYASADWALGTDVLPTKTNAAKEMAVWHIAMTLPQIGEWVAGRMLAAFGLKIIHGRESYTLEGYAAILSISAISFALGAYGLRYVKKAR
jgi:MFS family permease